MNYIVEVSDVHKGIITFLYLGKQYGFIQDYNGDSIFFHESCVCSSGFKDLREGMEVEFIVRDSPKGKRAIGVIVL